ncbi:type 1 glutamine amidotransferase family protein [Mesorhizobium sp. A623]
MQILLEGSEEFGDSAELGILTGRVVAVPKCTFDGQPQRVPHIGWNQLLTPKTDRSWDDTVMAPFSGSKPAFYFVPSFAPVPADPAGRLRLWRPPSLRCHQARQLYRNPVSSRMQRRRWPGAPENYINS